MMEESSLLFRFLMSNFGYGPTVRPQIAAQQFLAQQGKISWAQYAESVAKLVSDQSLYGKMIAYYRLQALGWGLTILAVALG